jgi:hypothetical protein
MRDEDIIQLASDLRSAFEMGDIEWIERLYGDDITVWHNYDQISRTRDQSLMSARWVADEISNFSIDDCEIFPVDGGYIQQCVFRGVYRSTGAEMETHAMIRVHCEDGKVTKIEDYSDPNQGSVPDIS